MNDNTETCPKCGSPLTDVQTTPTGKKLKRCSAGSWNSETKQTEGCDFVLWLKDEPQELDEKCPKCGSPLILQTTRFGKKMKKCSTSSWDPQTKTASGCDFVEWINGSTEALDKKCPDCGADLVLFTTAAGKKLEKCSTAGWDKATRKPTGCTYVRWLKFDEYPASSDNSEPPF